MRSFSSPGLLALSAVALVAGPAAAFPSFANAFRSIYPSSGSLDNVELGTGFTCQLCHSDTGGGDPWNGYGWDIRIGLNSGLDIDGAILAAEGLNSDQDPTGSTNLEEILASTQPGWTDGNNNTDYFADGTTVNNQAPPGGILGDLDPVDCGTTYCGPSQNPANAALISLDTCNSSSSSINVNLTNGPSNQFVYLLVGDGNGTVSQPPGAVGDLCVVGGSCLGRYDKDIGQIDTSGGFSVDILNVISTPCAGAVAISPGATWNFQFWHRQPMGQPATFSEAISVTFN